MKRTSHTSLYGRLHAHARATIRRLRRDQRGNVLMIMGLSILPLTFVTGMGIDYSRAMKLQTKLNAAADAAALAAVTNTMMSKSSAAACTAAKNMFVQQAQGLSGLEINANDSAQLTISIKDSASPLSSKTSSCSTSSASTTASYARTATVSYVAKSDNAFAGILGVNTLTIHGTSQANSAIAPNIDFYLVLDNSPSMGIAATQNGIDTMIANTKQQDGGNGCAFACHQYSVGNGDTQGNPIDPKTGKQMDDYALARSLSVVLRSDLVVDAASNLMGVASSTAASNGAVYRMSVATFDDSFHNIQSKTSDLAQAKTSISKITPPLMYSNGNAMAPDGKSGVKNNDTNTNFTAMNSGLAGILSYPGYGTKLPGDKPQGVIFIVTDGVRDEAVGGDVDNRWIGQMERPSSAMPYSRAPYAMDPQVCEQLKGTMSMRIAILYTSYLPLTKNAFYNGNVAPFQSEIGANLKSCASPGLFYEVSTDGDISGALAQLFQAAVATAHLTQ